MARVTLLPIKDNVFADGAPIYANDGRIRDELSGNLEKHVNIAEYRGVRQVIATVQMRDTRIAGSPTPHENNYIHVTYQLGGNAESGAGVMIAWKQPRAAYITSFWAGSTDMNVNAGAAGSKFELELMRSPPGDFPSDLKQKYSSAYTASKEESTLGGSELLSTASFLQSASPPYTVTNTVNKFVDGGDIIWVRPVLSSWNAWTYGTACVGRVSIAITLKEDHI